ncbi:hypothetical protein H632_c3382p0 [Helicosporidium sp. ATCC 50920]|nr:hypothetical protein H632_c3382p0 [Helicosporidium sp. ATCC 50920]|eukprot:KDD72410.1 hypothetical protein H632_c3382p0 [Helicosporidium sp. ATCC 50920]
MAWSTAMVPPTQTPPVAWRFPLFLPSSAPAPAPTPTRAPTPAPAPSPTAPLEIECIKRPYQPNVLIRKRRHGFLSRIGDRGGRRVIRKRKHKGRWWITA